MYIFSIMHHVKNALLTDYFRNDVLTSIKFFNQIIIFSIICISVARENDNYERLKFLNNNILKMLISTTLMTDH